MPRFSIHRSPLGLPSFLFPSVVGKVYRNHHYGSQIELSAHINNWSWLALVVWAGAMAAFSISVLGNEIIARIPEDSGRLAIAQSAIVLAVTIIYFYILAWKDVKYLKSLFFNPLAGSALLYIPQLSMWERWKISRARKKAKRPRYGQPMVQAQLPPARNRSKY
jgi:hypothetical protein